MKIDKSKAIEFLVALGFSKAGEWDDAKIKERLGKVPNKVQDDEVPEGHKDIYGRLVNSAADDPIELTGGSKSKGKSPKSKKKAEKAPAEKRAEKAPAEKEVATPSKSKKKAEKAPAETIERDGYGSRVGSISAKVNTILVDDWVDEQTIALEAGVTLDQARGRLYYASQEGLIECRRLVQYRLVKKGKE